MDVTPHEASPRYRRKSTFRLWSKEEEEDLLAIEERCEPVETHGDVEVQMEKLWVEKGHEGMPGKELVKKIESVKRIKEMLKKDPEEVGARRLSLSNSLLDDQKWEDDTLGLIKQGDYEGFSKRLSIERKASKVSDTRDRTALHHAAATGNLVLTQLIHDSSPEELETHDKDGRTPVFFALESAQDIIVDWMIENNVDLTVTDTQGVTPLHIAAHTNNRHCVRSILACNTVDINAADSKGSTPLHVAAHRASSDIIEMLLKAGADPSTKDKRGNLPEHLAKRMEKKFNYRRLSSIKSTASAVSAAIKFKRALTEEDKNEADSAQLQ